MCGKMNGIDRKLIHLLLTQVHSCRIKQDCSLCYLCRPHPSYSVQCTVYSVQCKRERERCNLLFAQDIPTQKSIRPDNSPNSDKRRRYFCKMTGQGGHINCDVICMRDRKGIDMNLLLSKKEIPTFLLENEVLREDI